MVDLRISAYSVIVDDHRRVLLSRWAEGRKRLWTLPGGGLNPGEDPELAARREAAEETGYRIEVGDVLGVHSRVVPANQRVYANGDEPLHQLRIIYRSEVVGGKLHHERAGSTDRAAWFPLAEIPEQRMGLVTFALDLAGLCPATVPENAEEDDR